MIEQWSEALRYGYPSLNKDSVVFDIGGFEGDWAMGIYMRYSCRILIFEPVEAFYNAIINKFHGNERARIYNFGLGTKNEDMSIGVAGMSTSVLSKGDEWVGIRDILPILDRFAKIDLVKINIEGAEYDLLEYIIANGAQTKLVNIQIQFHNNVADYEVRRQRIREALAKTHHLTYDFPVGLHENWELNKW